MEHYFTETSTEDIRRDIIYYINEEEINFVTSNAVFSKKQIDFGTNLMIKTFLKLEKDEKKKVLDIGCGYGVVGITLAKFFNNIKVTMADINERAVELSKENLIKNKLADRIDVVQSNIYNKIEGKFDFILSNPPIRAGKAVIYEIYEKAYEHLEEGGKLYVVIQKKQGANSSKEKIESIFGNCEMVKRDAGYQILVAKKL